MKLLIVEDDPTVVEALEFDMGGSLQQVKSLRVGVAIRH
jgi:hypothetical protein